MSKLCLAAFVLAVLCAVCAYAQPPAPAVPPEHRALYEGLQQKLTELEGRFDRLPKPAEEAPVVWAAELLTAKGHRGEQLLSPEAFKGNQLYLDRLQEMGIKGVKVAIPYPLLQPDFPRCEEYAAFYAKLADEIHRRGMKMHVGGGVMFPQSEFTTIPAHLLDYSTLTVKTFLEARMRQVETIVSRCHPDYITLANEPSTERKLTRLPLTPASYARYIEATVGRIRRPGLSICAGAGTWDAPAYVRSYVDIPGLDCIDLHFYPIDSRYQANMTEWADLAHAKGKRVIIGEAWLYKELGSSGSEANWAPTMGLDVFSFWAPLDQRFVTDMVRFARTYQVEYVSFYWSRCFFGYADWTEQTGHLPPGEQLKLGSQAALRGLLADQLSSTGRAYQKLTGKQSPPLAVAD
jgi:hypothetical protein